jgi:hypothetical protein
MLALRNATIARQWAKAIGEPVQVSHNTASGPAK